TSGLQFAWGNAHNDYLELLAELGAIGFLIPAALMTLVFFRAARAAVAGPGKETRLLGSACAGGIAAALIHSLTDFNLYVPAHAMALAWISGLAVGLPRRGGLQPLAVGQHARQCTQTQQRVLLLGSGLATL